MPIFWNFGLIYESNWLKIYKYIGYWKDSIIQRFNRIKVIKKTIPSKFSVKDKNRPHKEFKSDIKTP